MHSPSPTPEHSFADLLDVDSNVPDLMSDDSKMMEPSNNQAILDLFDAPNTDTTAASIFSASMTTGEATGLVTGVASLQENPFAGIAEEESSGDQAEEPLKSDYTTETASIGSEKRTSIGSTAEVLASEIEEKPAVGLEFGIETSMTAEPQASVAAAELFSTSTAEQASTAGSVLLSGFFSDAEANGSAEPFRVGTETRFPTGSAHPLFPDAETVGGSPRTFASDLLGDFGEPAKGAGTVESASPVPGPEFPTNEAYKPEEQLEKLAATTKAIESTGDAFDIFASKFDKAAEPDGNGDPFFDAFSAGGPTAMDTSSDGKRLTPKSLASFLRNVRTS